MSVVPESETRIASLPSGVQSIQYRVSRELPFGRAVLQSAWRWLLSRHEKRQSRRALLDLTDDALLDIGVTRADARKEAGKSFFWD